MASLNKTLLIGYLCADPEKRVTTGGNSVVSVSLATTDKWKDKQGNPQEKTEFHRLVIWQGADAFAQYTKKGSQVYIEGSLQTREWADKDGNKRYTTEINVRSFQFLDRATGQNQQQPQQQYQAPPQQNQQYQHPPNQDGPR
jgi:single-strand DNA-binding protein